MYNMQVVDMKLGIARLESIRNGNTKTLAMIYAEGRNAHELQAIIDLCTFAFDLLNRHLNSLERE